MLNSTQNISSSVELPGQLDLWVLKKNTAMVQMSFVMCWKQVCGYVTTQRSKLFIWIIYLSVWCTKYVMFTFHIE